MAVLDKAYEMGEVFWDSGMYQSRNEGDDIPNHLLTAFQPTCTRTTKTS